VSNATFPIASFAGLRLKSRTSFETTVIQEGDLGTEYRLSAQAMRRWRYAWELRGARDAYSERVLLEGWHAGHGGRRDNFLLVDPVDGVTRRVRFDDDELEFVRVVTGVYSCEFDMITVVEVTSGIPSAVYDPLAGSDPLDGGGGLY
jgi:hypothetical protein